jgi:hypothetical protein
MQVCEPATVLQVTDLPAAEAAGPAETTNEVTLAVG